MPQPIKTLKKVVILCAIVGSITTASGQTEFANQKTSDYQSSWKSSSSTWLTWDLNDDGGGNFISGDRPMFFYWDNDNNKFSFLIDTRNMSNLKAKFYSLELTSALDVEQVDISYLNPKLSSPGNYDYLRFGTESNYFGGLMHNIGSADYGDGDDFSIFTYNDRDLTFRTGTGNVAFFPSSGGNLGVGTADPQSKVHIVSTGTLGGKTNLTSSYFTIEDAGSNDFLMMDVNEIYSTNALLIGSAYDKDIKFRNVDDNGVEDLMTIKSNGRIGINTTSPLTQLHVNGTSTDDLIWPMIVGNPRNSSGTENNYGVGVKLKHSHNGENNKWGGIASVQEGSWANNSALLLYANETPYVRITSSGKMGIGEGLTTSGITADLTVDGNILAEEIKVESIDNGPDYVFEETYELTSLEELEAYIKTNKHLPEVPSAIEMKENGIELAAMNMLLLKKVEELTLHQIEMNKMLITQQELIEQQQKLLNKLSSHLSNYSE
ncbi:MAG: hypothetical protein RIC35_23275 [Marinoscillum sp.]